MLNDHVNRWLAAYHDGELDERRSRKVEAHLEVCEPCRVELEKLEALRALILESPEAEDLIPAEIFVAQVGLRLPRRPARPAWRQNLMILWGLVPVALLLVWIIFQAVYTQSAWMQLVLELGIWRDLESFVPPGSSTGIPLTWNLGVSAIIGLAILSWLASWWVRQGKNGSDRATE